MSEEKKGGKTAQPETETGNDAVFAPNANAQKKEPKCAIERLRKDSLKLFGVTTSTFDGATHGLRGKFTVKEMRERIKKWQGDSATAKKEEGK